MRLYESGFSVHDVVSLLSRLFFCVFFTQAAASDLRTPSLNTRRYRPFIGVDRD
jgi:hypothetical protein